MDREQARVEIRSRWRDVLAAWTGQARGRVNGEPSYICPICRNGEGPDGDGITFNPRIADGTVLHCFKCGFSGDVISLYRQDTGATYGEALEVLGSMIGISIDPYKPEKTKKNDNDPDYIDYYKQCRERLNDPEAVAYLSKRGISIDTARAYGLGYDPTADPVTAPGSTGNEYKAHPTPRIIIPCSDLFYIARSIDPNTDPRYKTPNPKGSRSSLFNARALTRSGAVYITEGAIDALSILECGRAAVGLNSADNWKLVVERLKNGTEATLILCLDNDKTGREKTALLSAELKRQNIKFITANISGTYKDPNEALTANRAKFEELLEQAERATTKPDNVSYYLDMFLQEEMTHYQRKRKTGFEIMDKTTRGIYPGLYCLAAASSVGKTTFALQLADQLAEMGNYVIYFSLEQSRLELVSKSIARTMAQQTGRKTKKQGATSSVEIRENEADKREVCEAIREYKDSISDRMSIVDANFSCTVSYIGAYLRRFAERNGVLPIVFIDYLQVLEPSKEAGKLSTKESMDRIIKELKQLSRELDITVFVISSVNRSNYAYTISQESIKESGGIEYTCDVIWGMQFQCFSQKVFEEEGKTGKKREVLERAAKAVPRKIELKALKDRFVGPDYKLYFDYYSRVDLFVETEEPTRLQDESEDPENFTDLFPGEWQTLLSRKDENQ